MAAQPIDVVCMATLDASCTFRPMRLQRRALNPRDVLIDMRFCGLCHTDYHHARNEAAPLMPARYPCVPGHELAGVVAAVGSEVTRFKVGDHAGVGCMVDACLACPACKRGEEQKCSKQVATYGAPLSARAGAPPSAPQHTLGGYTSATVVHEQFVVRIPEGYPLEAAGPIFCAGVTLYDPLRRYGGPLKADGTFARRVSVAVVGLGGLGAIGCKIAAAMGASVTAVTRSQAKAAFALTKCSAGAALLSTDARAMAAAHGTFDLVLNSIPVEHDWSVYTPLLKPSGKHVLLGLHSGLVAGIAAELIAGGRVVGSGIGCVGAAPSARRGTLSLSISLYPLARPHPLTPTLARARPLPHPLLPCSGIEATQAVIDLCAAKNILPEITVIKPQDIGAAYEALAAQNESGMRNVIDLASLKDGSAFEACAGVLPPRLPPPSPPISILKIVGSILSLVCCRCRH
jgi:uncharacterized zinc-type alcohol dehydrogenase-like protein